MVKVQTLVLTELINQNTAIEKWIDPCFLHTSQSDCAVIFFSFFFLFVVCFCGLLTILNWNAFIWDMTVIIELTAKGHFSAVNFYIDDSRNKKMNSSA